MMASTGSRGEERLLPSSSLPQVRHCASVKPAIPVSPESVAKSVFQLERCSIWAARTDGFRTVHVLAAARSQGT
jgi:hypothetical protein